MLRLLTKLYIRKHEEPKILEIVFSDRIVIKYGEKLTIYFLQK